MTTNLGLDVPKVDAQLLQKWGLAIVAFGRECGQPACPQPALLAHPSGDTARAGAEAGAIGRCAGWAAIAVGCLRGGRVAGHSGGGIARRVELEILGGRGARAVWRVVGWATIVARHF